MSGNQRHGFAKNVFSVTAKDLLGIRDSQSELWPDSRYVRKLMNFTRHGQYLRSRNGANSLGTSTGEVLGAFQVDEDQLVAMGTSVVLEKA